MTAAAGIAPGAIVEVYDDGWRLAVVMTTGRVRVRLLECFGRQRELVIPVAGMERAIQMPVTGEVRPRRLARAMRARCALLKRCGHRTNRGRVSRACTLLENRP